LRKVVIVDLYSSSRLSQALCYSVLSQAAV
jgi:hypothetical protein